MVDDPMALLVWAHKDALLARIEKLIAEQSDDAVALTTPQREQRLAQIDEDRLAVEREEAALVWRLQEQGASSYRRAHSAA